MPRDAGFGIYEVKRQPMLLLCVKLLNPPVSWLALVYHSCFATEALIGPQDCNHVVGCGKPMTMHPSPHPSNETYLSTARGAPDLIGPLPDPGFDRNHGIGDAPAWRVDGGAVAVG